MKVRSIKGRGIAIISLATAAAFCGGCADGNNSFLSTASVAPPPAAKVATAPKIDPACMALASQIDTLRKEGAVERLEKAATGKGATVPIKRTSLAKQAELNKANFEFQAKCGPAIPVQQTTQTAPATTSTANQVAATAAASAAAMPAKAAVAPAAQAAPKN